MALNLGAFLAGDQRTNGGGLLQQLQLSQQQQQQRARDAATINALKQFAAAQDPTGQQPAGASSVPGMPSNMPPVGGPVPIGAPSPPTGGGAPSPMIPPPTPGGAQGGFAGGTPNLMQMVEQLSKSGLPDDQQFEALKSYGAFSSPFEKMQQQLQLAQQKMQSQSEMLSDRLAEMDKIASLRASVTERGQDIGASNTDKRIGAEERGQDFRKEASDKKSANAVAPENKKAYDAAKTVFTRAAAEYQALTTPGRTPEANPEDVAYFKKKMDEAQTKMEALASTPSATPNASATIPTGAAPAAANAPEISQENLEYTAKKYGMTVEQVKEKLGVK